MDNQNQAQEDSFTKKEIIVTLSIIAAIIFLFIYYFTAILQIGSRIILWSGVVFFIIGFCVPREKVTIWRVTGAILIFLGIIGKSYSMNSESGIKRYILNHTFENEPNTGWYNSSSSSQYTFDENGSFEFTYKEKRNNSERKYFGNYQLKKSKFDNGDSFFYIKAIFTTPGWTDVNYLVFKDGDLIRPVDNNLEYKYEDETGLVIPEYSVSDAKGLYTFSH
jgi:hypothetical protein